MHRPKIGSTVELASSLVCNFVHSCEDTNNLLCEHDESCDQSLLL